MCGCGCGGNSKSLKDLSEATTPQGTDYFLLVQGGRTYKYYFSNLSSASGVNTVLSGNVVPSAGLGNNGDIYIDLITKILYKKVAGAWVSQDTLMGADGNDGVDGTNGTDGADGADGTGLEFNWSGTQLGVRRVGDVSYIYEDLQGDTGATGATGPAGSTGADGAGVDTGDLVMKAESPAPSILEWQELTGGTTPTLASMPAAPTGWKWYKKLP